MAIDVLYNVSIHLDWALEEREVEWVKFHAKEVKLLHTCEVFFVCAQQDKN